MCDCLDDDYDEGKPLTWTYVGQGKGDWAEAKQLEWVGEGKGAFIADKEKKPGCCGACWWRLLTVLGFLLCLVGLCAAVVIAFPALFRSADDMVVVDWYGCQLPTSGAAAAGAAIVEEAWTALDLDKDGNIPRTSLPLWTSQSLISLNAAQRLNNTQAVGGQIAHDDFVKTLLDSDEKAWGDDRWVGGAWVICDKNQDGKVTKIEMGFLQRHGSLKASIDEKLWEADEDADGALNRAEFESGLATVAVHGADAINGLFQEIMTQYWPKEKRDFCCASKGVCATVVVPGPLAASTTMAMSYDCPKDQDVKGWTEMRRAWCCSRHSVGCFSTVSALYDCRDEWKTAWSKKKQAWCCFHLAKGCKPKLGEAVEEVQGPVDSTAMIYPMPQPVPTVHTGDTHLVHERVRVYDLGNKVYDCDAGFASWRVGWSTGKKLWCCAKAHRACEDIPAKK